MFREMRRFKQQLSVEKCKSVLETQWRGVLSLLGDNDYPYGVPLNFYFDEKENKIYFHCAKEGHKLDAIKLHDKACFTVYDQGVKRENHWSKDYNCVITFGRISIVEDREKAEFYVRKLASKYFPDHSEIEPEMNAHFSRCECLELTIEHLSGKTVNES
ncbi:MAG: pyridoxamine 5'-phosphate oxidase family protein [Ruminococcus sp.]|nr:pyridoxamine 5'-phosphate oxidase family protein [Ruminococcus sp.]